ncbi:MAG: MarR family transcriptional regulator [Actinomycetales bacterium]|nr:MarR family transcriptional regulator [Tetrasphaera sp.]NLW98519.1 MarR family transcriptional regulator [Actinomycetales bacterium]
MKSDPDLATDLRLACLRIARRNRFESVIEVAPHQAAVLISIERGSKSAREIAAKEKISAPTVSRTIAALVEAGWVTRTVDPADGRRIVLAISDTGRRVLQETRRAREEWMSTRLNQLSEEDIELVRAALPVLERIARL